MASGEVMLEKGDIDHRTRTSWQACCTSTRRDEMTGRGSEGEERGGVRRAVACDVVQKKGDRLGDEHKFQN